MDTTRHGAPTRRVPQALLLSLVLAATACGSTSSYELSWTLGGATIQGAKDCSSAGVDAIEVIARRGDDAIRTIFGCFSAVDGARGRGPDLSSGPWALGCRALSPGGLPLTSEVIVQATIPEEGDVAVQVDVPRPSSCADGVDNDHDGAVDAADMSCLDAKGVYDPKADER